MYTTNFQEFKKNWKHKLGVLINVSREVVAIIENLDNIEQAIRENMAYAEEYPFKFISFDYQGNYSCTIEVELSDEDGVWTETFYLDHAVKY